MYFFLIYDVSSVIVNLACIAMLRTNLLIHSSDFRMSEDMEQFQTPCRPTFQDLQTYTAAQLQIFVHKFGLPTTVPKLYHIHMYTVSHVLVLTAHDQEMKAPQCSLTLRKPGD